MKGSNLSYAEAAAWVNAIGAVVAAIATGVGAGAAIVAVKVAYKQLTNLNNTLRMNGLMAVLQLENDMHARKQQVDAVVSQIRKEGLATPMNAAMIEILNDEMKGYIENWLNASDRLAYCINKGYLQERDWRAEYRDYFADLVTRHGDWFKADSPYTHILDLYGKWKRE